MKRNIEASLAEMRAVTRGVYPKAESRGVRALPLVWREEVMRASSQRRPRNVVAAAPLSASGGERRRDAFEVKRRMLASTQAAFF